MGSAFNIPHSFFNRKEEKALLLMDKGRKEIELKLCVSASFAVKKKRRLFFDAFKRRNSNFLCQVGMRIRQFLDRNKTPVSKMSSFFH